MTTVELTTLGGDLFWRLAAAVGCFIELKECGLFI